MTASPRQLVTKYLSKHNVMQLATCSDDKPYAVNLHYYSDEAGNLYWISTRERRHSRELAANPNACVAIKVHENTLTEPWVIGLTIEGTVECLGENPGQNIAVAYQDKLGHPQKLMDDIRSGRNPHKFYKLTPTDYTLFDTKNFPKDPKQEWSAA